MGYMKFEDNSQTIKKEINQKCIQFLYEAGMSVVNQVVDVSRVMTGQLRGSWDYSVDEGELEAKIGSPLENAIWEEFGTGLFAENGNGRQSAWKYKDAKGKWHTTHGKKGTKALKKSFEIKKKPLTDRLKQLLGEVGK